MSPRSWLSKRRRVTQRLATTAAGLGKDLSTIQKKIGYKFTDTTLLEMALTHRSWSSENKSQSNERLEFLGDAVLDLVVAEYFYTNASELDEGPMSQARASVVSRDSLSEAGQRFDLGSHIRFGRSDVGLPPRPSLIANSLEAIFGAVYLDGGIQAVTDVVLNLLGERIQTERLQPGFTDFKTQLQEIAAASGLGPPKYEMTESGPPHAPVFEVSVTAGTTVGHGRGTSKKRASQRAAESACLALSVQGNNGSTKIASTKIASTKIGGTKIGGTKKATIKKIAAKKSAVQAVEQKESS